MDCGEIGDLIHGYLDSELDLAQSLEIEQHLGSCPACSLAYANNLSLRKAIARSSLCYEAPESLRKRVCSAVRQASRAEAGPRRLEWRWKLLWASLGAVAAMLLLVFTYRTTRPAAENLIVQETLSAHVRSLMPGHLVDVASSDQHTVKPWFNGRLDFSPPVRDLAADGFSLAGGRLDYIGNRAVAALVYQRHRHIISLFIWPSTHSTSAAEKLLLERGYNLIGWTQSDMTYWAVSDVNVSELRQFVNLVRG